ncbi:hypothetical protein PMAYCL1PPCAC_33490 [Pristionchus mayeri]|uniref:Uncharacterized protein n=1 Tax=Pristionchus mayeri TaxID=1317129 RepID=A0AAN5DIL7_9BILA|nr:hypothetical protein PMAYCL1PPCAC_33490 [Pristionchus mayeri]
MIFIVILLIFLGIFLKISDSTLNLWFWSRVSRKTEASHYRGKVVWIVGGLIGHRRRRRVEDCPILSPPHPLRSSHGTSRSSG